MPSSTAVGALMPSWDSLWSLQTLVALAGTVGAVALGFVPHKWARIVGLLLLSLIAWYGFAAVEEEKRKPEKDYAYLFVHPNRTALTADGNVELFRRSTGILDKVKVCFVPTSDRPTAKSYPCVPNQEGGKLHSFDEGAEPFVTLPLGDWTFDIDPPSKLGKVLEQIKIVQDNGRAVTIFAQARRKEGNREILCETPQREKIPPCL